ncbi:class I SAM-dependent methyltransferase [Aquabacterium sp.]|uniref:class I SAM-dependent methyltransferase n=1 Tax=Aquabacterium sp. TaxID=1872578 RepID=UPI002487F84F|nr:class I SAM-dependent methyltransferase [Aquabacterium sp.]MDI1259437.1 class I SAM-dependent methyltransferase [Aquabacterium sp.]
MPTSQESTRVNPLLELGSITRSLSFAPAPWVLKQCVKTDFVYLENPPGYESLKEDFSWDITWKQEVDRRQSAEPIRYAVSVGVKKFRSQVIKRNKVASLARQFIGRIQSPTINLLDMGCGQGGLLEGVISALPPTLGSRCAPHGIELSTDLARIADDNLRRLGGRCIHDNALHGLDDFQEGYFDMIIMSSFLEHEINPLPLLRRCRERMREGGFIIIKVPNFDCWNRHMRAEKWCGFRWPDHVNYFTPKTLQAMINRADLGVARMNFMDRHPLSDSMYLVAQKIQK